MKPHWNGLGVRLLLYLPVFLLLNKLWDIIDKKTSYRERIGSSERARFIFNLVIFVLAISVVAIDFDDMRSPFNPRRSLISGVGYGLLGLMVSKD